MFCISRRRLKGVVAAAGLLLGLAGCRSKPVPEAYEVFEKKIAELQGDLRAGRTTCREVVTAYLDRILTYDISVRLNAITEVNPRALERAEDIDAALAAGDELGPLFCAPLIVKDNFDTYDLPTTGGSIALAGSLPPDDGFMVRRLREAGAIVLAKSNMAEWAFSPRQTVSSSYGTTANAYALDRVPAGSSGGTASAVAASFGVAGLGSDTGNSIRGPSSHLALFGIRSTIGLTSRDGVIPLFFDRDIAGPMTRTVEDGARIFNVIAGYDPADSYTEQGKGRKEPDYLVFLKKDALSNARLGVLRALADPQEMDPEVARLFEAALADLERLGAELIDPFAIADLERHLEQRDSFCPRFRYDVANYLRSLGETAPIKDVREAYESNQYSEYVQDRLESLIRRPADVHPRDWDQPCPDFFEHPSRQAFLQALIGSMDAAGVDAVIYPSWTHPPAHLDRAREEYRGDNSQLVAPATGTPAVTVPMGFTYQQFPAGLQILGRPYAEGQLFGFAYAYEQATSHRRPPALFPPLTDKPDDEGT